MPSRAELVFPRDIPIELLYGKLLIEWWFLVPRRGLEPPRGYPH